MATTYKRRSICLTKEMDKQLQELCSILEETPSTIMLRALNSMYQVVKSRPILKPKKLPEDKI